jgi:hypothetical protein
MQETVIQDPLLPAKLELHRVYEVPYLNGSDSLSLMFVRNNMIHQWESGLNKKSDYVLQGPPGIGKTLLSRGICVYSHFAKKMDICFVQMSLTGCSVVILQKVENQLGVQCYLHTNKLKVEELPDAITQKSPNLSMIVVDGINQKTFQKLVTLATTVAETQSKKTITCQIIFVTSQQVDFTKKHQMGLQLEQRLKTIDPQPVSWTLDEYKIACANKELWSQIAKTLGDNDQVEYSEEVLKEKFFYCGGSARWMFNFTIEDITNTIDTKVEELFNFTSVLSGSAGMSSQLAVNTLYQQFRGSSSSQRINFFISEYAMRRIVERVGDEAANFMWNWATASNYPPVKGLAYEGKCMAAWKNTAMSLNLIYLDKVKIGRAHV